MSKLQYIALVVLMAGISSLNPVAIDTFLPAMPEIAKAMSVDAGTIGITIGIFTVGNAIGQVSFGPISDRFGRKPVVYLGLFLFGSMALLSMFATNVETLAVIRFVQGIGAAVGRILAVAIVRDKYDKERAAKLLSNIWMFGSAMPIINPFIGGAILEHFTWTAVFIYMIAFACLMAVLTFFTFKETLVEKNPSALRPKYLLMNFYQISINRTFLIYTALTSFSASALYAFLAVSSDLIITRLHHSPTTFAYGFALVMFGSMTGSFISGRLSIKLGIKRMILIATLNTTFFGVIIISLALSGIFTIYSIIVPYALFRIGDAIISAQSMAGALSPFPDRAGSASSLIGFIRQLAGATTAIVVGALANGTPIPMATAMLICGVVPLGIYLIFLRNDET